MAWLWWFGMFRRKLQPKKDTSALGDGGWRVFADVCPHRLAPLSEGRVEPETGCLQCAYHGWEFDDQGKCKQIPSADIETCERACKMPSSQALRYPAEVAFSVIWAWLGESSPKASPSSLVMKTPLANEMVYKSYTRDLPYGYDTLVENLTDVSHIPFAHHGLQGTRKDATPIAMQVVSRGSDDVLTFEFDDRTMSMNRHASFNMYLPFLGVYRGEFDKPGKSPFKLSFLCIPVKPGWSRLILLYTDPPGKGHRSMLQRFPIWVVHLFSNKFLDSDLVFLHAQERALRQGEGKWQSSYFMPAKCDQPLQVWRRWLEREGARCVGPDYAKALPTTPPREELLNRFHQHTQFCWHCQSALEGISRWQYRVGKAGLCALALDRLQVGPPKLWLALQVLAVGVVSSLQGMKQYFHFVDYKHYLR